MSRTSILILAYTCIRYAVSCHSAPPQPASTLPSHMSTSSLPEIFMVENGVQILAPPEVHAMRDSFATYPTRGRAREGCRLTIMAPKQTYERGEAVIVAHFVESVTSEKNLYLMGPKPVTGEYVDGHLATAPSSQEPEPWVPSNYDGRVLKGPGIDAHFEATVYRFQDIGLHTIAWNPGKFKSNTLSIQVK